MKRQRHTPLDAEERALADTLAGLPAIEPSPELDARILAHAARAHATGSSTSRRPRRQRWWLGTGLGTAAAAVLAAGVAWQIGLFDIHLGSDVPVPRPQAPLGEPAAMSDAVSVDLEHPSRRAAAAAADEAAHKTESEPAPAAPAQRSAAPPAPPAPPAPAPPPATPPPVENRPAAARAIPSDAITTSAGAQAVREMALPHWRQDAQLPPEAWLHRIRERLQHGDQADARASLAAFRERHPHIALPADLATLGGQ